MNRVVVDTNIYISALVFGGLPRIILQLAEEKAFVLSHGLLTRNKPYRLAKTRTMIASWNAH